MSKLINIIGITLFFILGLFSFGFCEESMTITTYYPSPYGSYKQLSVAESGLQTLADYGIYLTNIATSVTDSINKYGMYISSTGTWSGASANNYGLYIDTPTGGTNNYGLIVAGGNVGIGTTSPGAKLHIVDTANPTGVIIGSPSSNAVISSPANIFLQVDSDNNATDQRFEVRKDGTSFSDGTALFSVLENGLIKSSVTRQGGSATSWYTPGTTTYTEANVVTQVGRITCTTAGTIYTVTYPTAFTYIPMWFLSTDQAGAGAVSTRDGGTTTFGITCETSGATVSWMAIGRIN